MTVFPKLIGISIVQNSSVNGSVVAQTFLNSQVGWMTRFHLYLDQVGPSGDLSILLTLTKNGAPDPNNVIATATLAHVGHGGRLEHRCLAGDTAGPW